VFCFHGSFEWRSLQKRVCACMCWSVSIMFVYQDNHRKVRVRAASSSLLIYRVAASCCCLFTADWFSRCFTGREIPQHTHTHTHTHAHARVCTHTPSQSRWKSFFIRLYNPSLSERKVRLRLLVSPMFSGRVDIFTLTRTVSLMPTSRNSSSYEKKVVLTERQCEFYLQKILLT